MKKVISFILVLSILLGLFSGLSFNSSAEDLPGSGSCGTNVTYTFDSSIGLLTISGSGAMNSYFFDSPFYEQTAIKTIVVNSGVTSIGDCAFRKCSSLTSITIPNSVTSIGGAAFENCDSLTSITIPNSVTSIGGRAFCYCSKLASVTILEGTTEIGSAAFACCSELIYLKLPNSLVSIGWDSFSGCKSLSSVEIPNGVKEIGRWAFAGCDSLNDIIIPTSVDTIEPDAFIETAYYKDENNWQDNVLYIGNYLIKANDRVSSEYTVNDGTVAIAGNAFSEGSADVATQGIETLKSVIIPDSVKTIGPGAFGACSNLTTVTIGSGITNIRGGAFEDCSGLTDVYYTGSQEQWNNIYIESYNEQLTNATIHYNFDPNHVHSYKAVVTPPTCTAKGFTTHTCACGDSYKDTYVNALGHKWDAGKVTKKATPTATGIKTYTCKVCKAKKTSTIAKCAKYANTLTVKGKKVNASFAKLKKANLSIAKNSVLSITKAQGKLTYAKTSGNKSISINKTKGTIQIKKGIKKGTYKIGVKVTAAGNASYKAGAKTATVTIVVK